MVLRFSGSFKGSDIRVCKPDCNCQSNGHLTLDTAVMSACSTMPTRTILFVCVTVTGRPYVWKTGIRSLNSYPLTSDPIQSVLCCECVLRTITIPLWWILLISLLQVAVQVAAKASCEGAQSANSISRTSCWVAKLFLCHACNSGRGLSLQSWYHQNSLNSLNCLILGLALKLFIAVKIVQL